MTLEDKIRLCSGEDFWHTKQMRQYGIPSVMLADGPHGLRKQVDTSDMLGVNRSVPATCFPTAVLLACSWDETLLEEIGKALGEEAKRSGVSVLLGPGANIKRNPLCGRNFEYFSEDPYLTGKMAAAHIRGIESTGVMSCLKHFALNNQEYKRFSSDSIADERTMREIYLRGFEIAVKEGKPSTVMCAYNKINGVHCSDNKKLLTEILRSEWRFDGMVVTDWGAMSDRIRGFQAGCDLSMPGGSDYMERDCLKAVREGRLSVTEINNSARRVLRMVRKAERTLKEESAEKTPDETERIMKAHYDLAKRAAVESMVLLKNEDHILPIREEETERVVFIGHMAEECRYQGAGSSHINPWRLTGVRDACPEVSFVDGCDAAGNTDEVMLEEVRKAAADADKVVVFAGLTDAYESEGFDRESMEMPGGHVRMIEAAAAANPNTAVVLMCGSPVEIPWESKVRGILYAGLGGEACGEAIKGLLFGEFSPCGKLAETWPLKYQDCVCSGYYGEPCKDAQYREGIYVGYRYYDTAGKEVRYPFGFGLSYTTFSYSDLQIRQQEDQVLVQCRVTNTGNRTACEITECYIAPGSYGQENARTYRAARELKAFARTELAPGETKTVRMKLERESFAVWDHGWKVPEGNYEIQIGSSSRDIRLRGSVSLKGDALGQLPVLTKVPGWYLAPAGIPEKKAFEKLLGHRIAEKPLKKGSFTMDSTILEMKDYSLVMKIMYYIVRAAVARGFHGKPDDSDPHFRMMMRSSADCSLSGMKINGGMNNHVIEGLLDMANGHYLRGLIQMMKRNRMK